MRIIGAVLHHIRKFESIHKTSAKILFGLLTLQIVFETMNSSSNYTSPHIIVWQGLHSEQEAIKWPQTMTKGTHATFPITPAYVHDACCHLQLCSMAMTLVWLDLEQCNSIFPIPWNFIPVLSDTYLMSLVYTYVVWPKVIELNSFLSDQAWVNMEFIFNDVTKELEGVSLTPWCDAISFILMGRNVWWLWLCVPTKDMSLCNCTTACLGVNSTLYLDCWWIGSCQLILIYI